MSEARGDVCSEGRGAIVVDVPLQQRQPLRVRARLPQCTEDGAAVDLAQLGEETARASDDLPLPPRAPRAADGEEYALCEAPGSHDDRLEREEGGGDAVGSEA